MKKLETAKNMLLSGESLTMVRYATGISRNDILAKTDLKYDHTNKRWYDSETTGKQSEQWNNKAMFI